MDGHLAISVTLLLALIGAVWRFSASNATLTTEVKALREERRELSEQLKALGLIPVLEQRVGQLEGSITKATSIWPKLESRIAVLEQRMGSTADKLRAVRTSRPDPGEVE